MPKLTIDQSEVEVPEGATVLDAARRLGIDIPSLCHRDGCEPSTSCLACLVRINGQDRLVPSCATAAAEGMAVDSETERIHEVRRTALELLLSDHLGDCIGPCQSGCPAQMDIPTMLRQIAAGQMREAIATIKRDIALPAVLGRICPAPCEKVCRRADLDAAVSICLLKRLAADVDLASPDPYAPPCAPPTGKHTAVIGAGPTGLSAAYYLTQAGHACTIFEQSNVAGGRLLNAISSDGLPCDVLDAEITQIVRVGVVVESNRRIGAAELTDLRSRFDAVLLACGTSALEQAAGWSLPTSQRGLESDPATFAMQAPGLFAAGLAVRGKALIIRSVADGKEAAGSIDSFLRTGIPCPPPLPFTVRIGRMHGDELARFCEGASRSPRAEPSAGVAAGFTPTEGAVLAARCLDCDCRALHTCKLRKYAALYGAHPRRFQAERRSFEQDARHADVVYEPGKCIDCGLCIRIAAAAGEPLGLTFVGRGFNVRVAVPLNRSLAEALTRAAADCIAACPTAALAWSREDGRRAGDSAARL